MTVTHARAALALLAIGCASAPATPPTTTTATNPAAAAGEPGWTLKLPRLRIVDATLGDERSSRQEPLVVPFGPNQNGTELVYALLEQAGQKGAAAVGDLTLFATFRWRGASVECRMRVMMEGDARLAPRAAGVEPPANGRYDTRIDVYQPQPIDLVTDDRELECRTVQVAVTKKRLVQNASDRSAEARFLGDLPSSERELVTKLEKRDECRWKQVTRRTTRYDYELKLGFVPPNWEHFSQRFSRKKIVPAAPQCYTLPESELSEQPPYRLVATAYHRGKIALRAPRTLPSRAAVDAQLTPMNLSPQQCEALLKAATGKKRGIGNPNVPGSPDQEESGLFPQCSREQQLENFRRQRAALFYEEEQDDRYAEEDDEIRPFDAD